jgi:hypothetical protein
MMKCDICARYVESGTLVSASQMREAVLKLGFNPFTNGLISKEMLSVIGRPPQQAYEEWTVTVRNDQTDWNLCSTCFAVLKPLVGQPKSSGVTTNPAFNADEWFASAGGDAFDPVMKEIAFGPLRDAMKEKERAEQAKAKSGCFIATAACGSAYHPEVQMLRNYRDRILVRRSWGRAAIEMYQQLSPPIADRIREQPWARKLVRGIIVRPMARWAGATLRNSEKANRTSSGSIEN